MKVPADVIRARAESFTADMDKVPARFNMLEIQGATVIVDYGHNADALAALDSGDGQVPAPAADLRLQRRRATAATATSSARAKCWAMRSTRWSCTRTTTSAAAPKARSSASSAAAWTKARAAKQIDEIRGADAAVEFALRRAQPGDLILVQADTVDETRGLHPQLRRVDRAGAGAGGFARSAVRGRRRAGRRGQGNNRGGIV